MNKDILYPLRRLHGLLYEWEQRQKRRREAYNTIFRPIKQKLKYNPNAVFLVMTPEHGNLGDHAIAYAETELLHEQGISYIEVTEWQINILKRYGWLDIMNGYPIFCQGGGYLGTLWFTAEENLRRIIRCNPKSPIIIFPQTIFYEDNDWGREELQKSIQIYNQHNGLTIYAREKTSYDFMKPIYRDVRLMPDMVMSLKRDDRQFVRSGCLLCLRSDCEKTRTDAQEQLIREQARAIFADNVKDTDMIDGDRIPVEQRESALDKKFAEFASAELVITDRLHGMVFCAITGTPCIVVDSKSPKVRGCYEWIRHLDYIRFADDMADIAQEYEQIPQTEHYYNNSHILHYYEELAKVVKEYARN